MGAANQIKASNFWALRLLLGIEAPGGDRKQRAMDAMHGSVGGFCHAILFSISFRGRRGMRNEKGGDGRARQD